MRLTTFFMFGAIVLLSGRELAAQGEAQPLVVSYRRSLAATRGPADIPVGARVRIRLTDTLVQLNSAQPVGRPPVFEGTLLAIDSSTMQVRLDHGWRFDLPATSVATLEVRTGPGWCRRSRGARALCVTGGTLASVGIGFLAGRMIGQQVSGIGGGSYSGAQRRRWTVFGIVAGLGLARIEVPRLGRDTWQPVPGWTLGPAGG